MNTKDGSLQLLIDQMDLYKNVLVNCSSSDDLYYDTIKCISNLKLLELRDNFNEINKFLIQMGKLNFSRRLPLSDNDSITNYIATALNFLCEELEEKYNPKHYQILDLLTEFVIITDLQGYIKFCNSAFLTQLQIPKNALKGCKIFDLILNKNLPIDLYPNGFQCQNVDIAFCFNDLIVNTKINLKELNIQNCSEFVFTGTLL